MYKKIENIRRSLLVSSIALLISNNVIANNEGVIEPLMVTIPAGEFMMGSDTGRNREAPIHKVKIKSFQLSKYEVTVKEFRQFVDATGYSSSGEMAGKCFVWRDQNEEGVRSPSGVSEGIWSDSKFAPSEYHPVLCVSPKDAQAYISWLNSKTDKSYRLPTESEWEYASGAGSDSQYFFGDDAEQLCHYGNVFDQRGRSMFVSKYSLDNDFAACDDKAGFTSVVGMYRANAFGIYDTIGNVGEIVSDCEHNSYKGAPTDGSAWTTDCDLFRNKYVMNVHRGGSYSFASTPNQLRTAKRWHIGTSTQSSLGEGFRIAMEVTDKSALLSQPSDNTIQFAKALASAQNQELKRRQKIDDFPAVPSQLSLTSKNVNNEFHLSWKPTKETEVFNVYRSDSIGADFSPIATGLSSPKFIDKPQLKKRYSYAVTAVEGSRESLLSDIVIAKKVIKSSKDRIEAEDYNDTNGIKIGVVRQNEEPEGGFNLTGAGGINKGNWTEYLIAIESDGYYKVDYRVASADGSNGFELHLDDSLAATFSVPETGGWRKWQTVSSDKLYIKAGQYNVRMKAIDRGWKLNWFEFVRD